MSKVKWGVLGCSSFARSRTIPAMIQAESVDLIGIASRSAEKAEVFRREFQLSKAFSSYESLLEEPEIDAVYIPLPNALHAHWMIEAMQHGKNVLSEKPFTVTVEEAEQVAQTAKKTGKKCMEAFMWRFNPMHTFGRQIIREGHIGVLRLIRTSFTFSLARQPNVRLDSSLAGGSVMDVGCYCIAASRFYFENEPLNAYARGAIDPEYGVDMRMSGLLEFAQGYAEIDSGFQSAGRQDLELVGEKGRIYIPAAWTPSEQSILIVNGVEEKVPLASSYVEEFEHFSKCILTNQDTRYGVDDAVLQMKVVEAVLHSIHSGLPEKIG
jgi:predicted dehydrogenase